MMDNPSAYAREFVRTGVLASVPIIDCHAHMGEVYGTSIIGGSADEMVKAMDRKNIEMIFCAPHSALFDPAAANGELEAALLAYPGRIKGYFAFNPNYAQALLPQMGVVLEKNGYLGFKLLPEYHRHSLCGEGYRQVLEFANTHGLLVLCHTWGGSACNGTAQVRKVLRQYPNIRFIMGHAAPGECDIATALAREYEHAYVDICDIHRHNGILERMVQNAGADKILFGTDIPWYDPTYCLGSVLFADIPDEDKYKILYGNAKRLAQIKN